MLTFMEIFMKNNGHFYGSICLFLWGYIIMCLIEKEKGGKYHE